MNRIEEVSDVPRWGRLTAGSSARYTRRMGRRLSILALPGEWSIERLVALRVCGTERVGEVAYDEALYPAIRPCVVNVPGYTCIFWSGLSERLVTREEDEALEERVVDAIGDDTAYYFFLLSTINLYSLNAWRSGQCLRRLLGWSGALQFDEGPALPDEQAEREQFRVEVVDGLPRFHDNDGEAYTHDQVGENFVMAAAAAVFGVHLGDSEAMEALLPKLPQYETWDEYNARVSGRGAGND